MTSRATWFEPRQEQMNPWDQHTDTGATRGYDKEIREKLNNLNNFIEQSSALYINAFPSTPREQTDAKIAIIETMLAQSDQHDATCNEIIKKSPCFCFDDENNEHIITRRNLKLFEEVLLGIKKHLVNEPPDVLINGNTYLDEANDIKNRLARFQLEYHRPEHQKDCTTFFRNKHPRAKTLEINFEDVRDGPTQIELTRVVLAEQISNPIFEEIHGDLHDENDQFTDYVKEMKKLAKKNITRMHTSSRNPYERTKMVYLALSYFECYKTKTFRCLNGQTFQLKDVWTNEPITYVENLNVAEALEDVFGLRKHSYSEKTFYQISLDIIENWQLAGAQIFGMYQLAIYCRMETFLPNEEIPFPNLHTERTMEIDKQAFQWTLLEKCAVKNAYNKLPKTLTKKKELLAKIDKNMCKHIIAGIDNKWRSYPITKIMPRSLSHIFEMDHVINREIAVALTTNVKDNVNWEKIKLAFPFKNKCIEKISQVLQNQGQM